MSRASPPPPPPPPPADRRHSFELQATIPASAWHLVDPSTWSAGATLVFGAITYHLSSRRSELTSELLCWLLLPLVFTAAKRGRVVDRHAEALPLANAFPEGTENGSPSAASLWLVAISLALCSVFRAESGAIVLFPALAPLLLLGLKYLRPGLLHPPVVSCATFIPLLTYNILGATLAAIFAIAALSEWDPLGYALSAIPLVALTVAYTLLTPQSQSANRLQWLRSCDIEASAWPLSLRIAAILAVVLGRESYVIGFPSTDVIETLTLGLAKAFTWYFASQLAHHASWLGVTVASTFGLLATRNPFSQQTDVRALMTVIASLISLGQTLCLLPKQAKARLALWALALIPLLPYFANLVTIHLAQSSALVHADRHPVELLIREAKENFDGLLRNQSNTYSAAYAEYQRRYGFEPPRGFEDWYKFAQAHRSPIIDEFNIISEGIAPFMRLSGKEVLEVMTNAYDEPDHELWSCAMSGEPTRTQCSHHGRENDRNNAQFFDRITRLIPATLNLKFLLNHLDEPTVIIPPPSEQASKLNITNLGGQRAWESLTKFCSSRKGKSTTHRNPPIETYGLPFVTDHKAYMDLCEHAEYSGLHGLLAAPESLRLTEGLVPVLSTGTPSTMGDLLYPSTAYIEEDRFRYHEEEDMDWDRKQNNVYWAGSTTGGHGREVQWRNLHRQRFVELAQNLKPRVFSYLQEKNGVVSRVASWFLNGRLYDVAFTNVLQCDARPCREQRQYFRNKPWAPGSRPFGSRLVFDLDGNGISGRYYRLLASRSAPLKQTVLREWHDERLAPWVHYVPVSQSMDELPELVAYLTSTENGRRRAREIADQGRRWYTNAFREIDIAIYIYRLLLELTRLQDPDRPASQMRE
ncbi:putative beta- -xylosyltransferase 1 [Rosellinia necatrix]|uniref:Putative beta--xylosyltransferase 1 n=1 Tax=Rosellinia necatrix TaxID=77044 RepID=A0A1W2TIL7_ROSNE|nr:putative beta- -xylosyltransferase 1 [Rosellinia necatrix]